MSQLNFFKTTFFITLCFFLYYTLFVFSVYGYIYSLLKDIFSHYDIVLIQSIIFAAAQQQWVTTTYLLNILLYQCLRSSTSGQPISGNPTFKAWKNVNKTFKPPQLAAFKIRWVSKASTTEKDKSPTMLVWANSLWNMRRHMRSDESYCMTCVLLEWCSKICTHNEEFQCS